MKYVIAMVDGDSLETYKDDDGKTVFFEDVAFAQAYRDFELGEDTDFEVYRWD